MAFTRKVLYNIWSLTIYVICQIIFCCYNIVSWSSIHQATMKNRQYLEFILYKQYGYKYYEDYVI